MFKEASAKLNFKFVLKLGINFIELVKGIQERRELKREEVKQGNASLNISQMFFTLVVKYLDSK